MRKGGKIRFQKLQRKKNNSIPHCLRTYRALCTTLTCILFFQAAFLFNRGFFSSFFFVSDKFNRLQHFGVTFSWGGQLKCTIISCRKWQWNEKWGGSYWIAKNVFAVQTQPAVRDVPCPSALRPGTAWHLRVESLVFARACLLSFLLFLRLITLQSVPRFAASSQYIWAKVVRGNTLITF